MNTEASFSYDTVPYPSRPFSQTHPDRLCTMGRLFGMTPAPIDRCRVLELGCYDGANLIPMACLLHESEFIGVDLAGRAVAHGTAVLHELGLSNARLLQMDVMDINPSFGQFDYICAHGLYSWVPSAVRDKVLDICHRNLAPDGIAYVSYNAMPGSHISHMFREMMLFHVRNESAPLARVNQARSLLRFIASGQERDDAQQRYFLEELTALSEKDPDLLHHDNLAEVNDPVYFREFVQHAARHGLQYLAEAVYADMQSFPEPVAFVLAQMKNDLVSRETYLDFLKFRRFRQTLLCHAAVPLNRDVNATRLNGLYFVSAARPLQADLDPSACETADFHGPKDATIRCEHPVVKAALLCLSAIFPEALSLPEILERSYELLGARYGRSEKDEGAVQASLLQAHAANLIEVHSRPSPLVRVPGGLPETSALARWQAAQGPLVTSLRHSQVRLEDPVARKLLSLLDGTRDRQSLTREMSAFISEQFADQPEKSDQILENLATDVNNALASFGQMGLLVQ